MVEIVGKSYKQIQVKEEISQLDFLEATEEAWDYVAGTYTWFDPDYISLTTGERGVNRIKPSWPDHKESGGLLSLRSGYDIIGIEKVRKGNWGLHIKDQFYTNLRFLSTEHRGVAVKDFGVFLGNCIGVYPMHIAWDKDYYGMTEMTKYDGVGFSVCMVHEDGQVVAMSEEYISRTLGIPSTKEYRAANIFIPA